MAKNRNRAGDSAETAVKIAEGIGDALGRIVNRLESLDAEREKVYGQLLALQERLNVQVDRAGKALGGTVTTPAAPRRGLRSRLGKKTTAKTKVRRKARVRCGVCGTLGHNARGHARWQAAKNK